MDNQESKPIENQFQILTLILSEHQCQKMRPYSQESGICRGILTIGRGDGAQPAFLNLLGIKARNGNSEFPAQKRQGKRTAGSFMNSSYTNMVKGLPFSDIGPDGKL